MTALRKYNEETIDPSEGVTFEELQRCGRDFGYPLLRQVFEQNHFKVMHPTCYVEESEDDALILRDDVKLKKAYRNMYCLVSKKRDDTSLTKKVRFVDYWLDDPKIRTYKSVSFLPPPLVCAPDVYNLWKGFAAERLPPLAEAEAADVSLFISHVDIMCNHDAGAREYFLKWLAHIFQRPGEINGVSLVFLSKQGAGKNIFFNKLSQIMGQDLYYETSDPERDLFSRFSNGRKNRLLIDIDCEQLNNMITSEVFNYEQKGMDPVTMRNFARVVFTTNNSIPIKVTSDTRRYVIIECSSEKAGNADYFKTFAQYMDDPVTQRAIFDYLMGIDLSEVDWIGDRPKPL